VLISVIIYRDKKVVGVFVRFVRRQSRGRELT
jgi:hypothetical protein